MRDGNFYFINKAYISKFNYFVWIVSYVDVELEYPLCISYKKMYLQEVELKSKFYFFEFKTNTVIYYKFTRIFCP